MYGFILTRYVNSEMTNNYWIEAYNCIRRLYPTNMIMIIDDNSDYNYIKYSNQQLQITNCIFVQSEFIGRGELLAYYYFYKLKPFEKAVVIHDSCFMQQKIDFDIVSDFSFLWADLVHVFDDDDENMKLINQLKCKEELTELYQNKEKWAVSFGIMSVIHIDFLEKLVNNYDFFNLLNVVTCRKERMCLERIFGLICSHQKPYMTALLGSIQMFPKKFTYVYTDYITDKIENQPILKVWSGR